jgi:8-oxo-dGTP pyrophosphatase MutT (NUDIX family)
VGDIRAAGFVVYRRRPDSLEYLTLRMAHTGDWGFPKGHNDEGEPDLEAAFRETGEETGLGRDVLVRNEWFERTIGYTVQRGPKSVWYGLAECTGGEVALSCEHDAYRWEPLAATLDRFVHDNLKGVLRDAAMFLKDPSLRTGLDAAAARKLFTGRFPGSHPVVAHTRLVAGMAHAIAAAWGGLDAGFVEACAWLHDVGRCIDHRNHPVEGFRLLVELGYPGYAPTCISHYTKGRPFEELPREELWRSCDLSTFEPHEKIVALADYLAVRERKGTIEQRHADLVARYGASRFLDRGREIALGLKREFEERSGRELYAVAET